MQGKGREIYFRGKFGTGKNGAPSDADIETHPFSGIEGTYHLLQLGIFNVVNLTVQKF